MRTLFLSLLVLGMAALAGSAGLAEAPPHEQFLKALRDEGQFDLAIEYLNRLRDRNLAPEMNAKLPVELARTRLQRLATEPEEAERAKLVVQARGELESFLKANPQHPLRPQVLLELARVLNQQGRAQVAAARRVEGDARLRELVKSRPLFVAADKQFAEAAKEIEARQKALGDGDSSEAKAEGKQLVEASLASVIDAGINTIDHALTYTDEADRLKRGELLVTAQKALEAAASRDEGQAQSWVARAWATFAAYELDDFVSAEKNAKAILAQDKKAVASNGIRLVKYFNMRKVARDPKSGPKEMAKVQKDAETWLENYRRPVDRESFEGVGVQYLLGTLFLEKAKAGIKRDPKTGLPTAPPTGDTLSNLNRAEYAFRAVAASDNEFTERAAKNRVRAVIDRQTGRTEDPAKLKTFEECYLAAQVEQLLTITRTAPGEDGKMLVSEDEAAAIRAKGYRKVAALLEQGLKRATPRDPRRDVFGAQYLHVYALGVLGRTEEAAVLADHLARANAKQSRYALMANQALVNYNVSLQSVRESPESARADMARVFATAKFMDEAFPEEPITDVARHQLGFFLMRQKDYAGAVGYLAKLKPGYAEIADARRLQGAAAFLLVRPAAAGEEDAPSAKMSDADKKALLARAIADLAVLPVAPPTAPAGDAVDYVKARMQLGQLYTLDSAQYAKAEEIGKALIDQIPKFVSVPDEERNDLLFGAKNLAVQGVLAQAQKAAADPMTRDLAKVMELLAPVLKQGEAEFAATPGQEPNRQLYRNTLRRSLVLALRTTVQDNQIDRAKEILERLQKAGGNIESTIGTLQEVVRDVRNQILALRKKGETDAAAKMGESFSLLLEQISRTDKLPNTMLVFLANGYSSIDGHEKGVELLERIAAPMGEEAQNEVAVRAFHSVQFQLASMARKAKQYDKSKKLLDEAIGDNKKPGWGYGVIPVRKERCLLLEDQNKFQDALKEWTAVINPRRARLKPLPKAEAGNPLRQQMLKERDIFFDLFLDYQRCLARGNSTKKEEVRKKAFEKIAAQLADLEAKNEDLSNDRKAQLLGILEEYPLLKDMYKTAGGKLLDAPPVAESN